MSPKILRSSHPRECLYFIARRDTNLETIHLEFVRLTELRIVTLLDSPVGTYVLWDSRANSRPTYIGEGNILSRFEKHRARFKRPLDGYVALFDETEARAKTRATMLEALLLHISAEVGRSPTQNATDGKWKHLNRLFNRHGVVKFFIGGFDPLAQPQKARRLSRKNKFALHLDMMKIIMKCSMLSMAGGEFERYF